MNTVNRNLFMTLSTLAFCAVAVSVWPQAALAAPPGEPTTHKCTSPVTAAKLQDKIGAASEGEVIEVEGDCVGFNYVVATDGLTLRGVDGATITGDGLAPAITIAADNVTIQGWDTIDGDDDVGILVRASGSGVVRDISLITGEDGVTVTQSAFVEIKDVTKIEANDDGVTAALNGTADISNTEITGNSDDGVVVVSGGAVNFSGGVNLHTNGDVGLLASGGQVSFFGANTVENNGGNDIQCVASSRVVVFQTITSSTDKSNFTPNYFDGFCTLAAFAPALTVFD